MIATESVVQADVKPAAKTAPTSSGAYAASAEALKHLALTRSAFRRLKESDGTRLDPWEATSLAVAEQALERAWLALSQLHADLQGPPRRA